jgi:branched-chain amino acid transport system ATP-binding protein
MRWFVLPIWGSKMSDRTLALQVVGLSAWYGQSEAVRRISFEVRQGETVAILGRNGAGKSTTLKSLMGVHKDRKGEIRLNGTEISSKRVYEIARLGLAYVPEERAIFSSLTVEENLHLPPVIFPSGMTLEEIYTLFPNLWERPKAQGTKLSGGEQQMLAIARVLRTGSRVLLLDEPTEGLAPVIVKQMAQALNRLKAAGYTILLVEQNFEFSRRMADRFYLMEEGSITMEFSADAIHRDADLLRQRLSV